jgi:hypothetical protein
VVDGGVNPIGIQGCLASIWVDAALLRVWCGAVVVRCMFGLAMMCRQRGSVACELDTGTQGCAFCGGPAWCIERMASSRCVCANADMLAVKLSVGAWGVSGMLRWHGAALSRSWSLGGCHFDVCTLSIEHCLPWTPIMRYCGWLEAERSLTCWAH